MRRLAGVVEDVEVIEGDIRDAEVVRRAMKGIHAVHHLAFVNGTGFFYSQPDLVLDVGVKGMVNVLDAAIEHKVQEFVLASSSEVYQAAPVVPTPEEVPLTIPDPLNPRFSYAAGKIISEIMAINFGRKHFSRTVIFRPHNVYGPDMGWEHVIPQFAVRMARLADAAPGRISLPIQGDGAETRAFIYISDFVDGLIRVIEKGENLGIYHIGTTEECAIGDLARLVGRCFGRDIEVVRGAGAEGSVRRRCPDVRKLAALGFKQQTSLPVGIGKTVEWYRAHTHLAPSHASQ